MSFLNDLIRKPSMMNNIVIIPKKSEKMFKNKYKNNFFPYIKNEFSSKKPLKNLSFFPKKSPVKKPVKKSPVKKPVKKSPVKKPVKKNLNNFLFKRKKDGSILIQEKKRNK
jgi:hypothetical protein